MALEARFIGDRAEIERVLGVLAMAGITFERVSKPIPARTRDDGSVRVYAGASRGPRYDLRL